MESVEKGSKSKDNLRLFSFEGKIWGNYCIVNLLRRRGKIELISKISHNPRERTQKKEGVLLFPKEKTQNEKKALFSSYLTL